MFDRALAFLFTLVMSNANATAGTATPAPGQVPAQLISAIAHLRSFDRKWLRIREPWKVALRVMGRLAIPENDS